VLAVPDEATGWRLQRGHIVRATDREGTFLDVGCANGLLMESVVEWADHRIEPYGLDIAPRLVELARERLPHWADRSRSAAPSITDRSGASPSYT
jgi:2-polyprenyl-3-methyl-5-hydroxy-6-metoxy-1,4-benzoquinol methylase